ALASAGLGKLESGWNRISRRRVGRLQTGQDIAQDLRHREVAEPVSVGRDDVPGREVRRTALEDCLKGSLVVGPELSLVQVAHLELPLLGRVVDPLLEPLTRFVRGDVQEELD